MISRKKPITRIAVFSDVHANLPALEAVLKDIENRKIDQLYCLGDLVDFAPWGNEVIHTIRKMHIPCLMGNHDERIAFDYPVIPLQHHDEVETKNRILAINHSKANISDDNKRWLGQLPYQFEISFKTEAAFHRILLVHASPRSNDEYIYESHSELDLLAMQGDRKVDALVMGHTHMSYIKPSDVLLLNCGSVGRSKEEDRKATYCILNIHASEIVPEIIKLDYPITYVAREIYNSAIPDFYADFLLLTTG